MKTVIRFVKNIGAYSPGDNAGFEDEQAQAYIDNGYAEPVARPELAAVDVPAPAVDFEAGHDPKPTPNAPVHRKGRAKP